MLKILLDTDICGDCDDVAALSLLNYFKNEGKAEILCVTECLGVPYGVGCVDAVCRYYGNLVDIGSYRGEKHKNDKSLYTKAVCEQFPNGGYAPGDVPEAYKLMRKKLAENNHVKIVTIGFFTNLALLVDSPPDEFSPLNGLELIEQKVDEIVVMGGIVGYKYYNFEGNIYDKECNIIGDLEASKTVFSKLKKTKITLIEFELGYRVLSFENVVKSEKESPIKTSFLNFLVQKRESWDPITVMYAVLGTNGLYDYSDWGELTVTEAGQTLFVKKAGGNVRYLIEKVDKQKVVETLNAFPL